MFVHGQCFCYKYLQCHGVGVSGFECKISPGNGFLEIDMESAFLFGTKILSVFLTSYCNLITH